jgi:hypothetical protein
MNVKIEANNCCYRENIGTYYKVRFSCILTKMPDSLFQRKIFSFKLNFLKGGSTLFNMRYLQQECLGVGIYHRLKFV